MQTLSLFRPESLKSLQRYIARLPQVPSFPRPLKWLFFLILLANVRSTPFLWHFRVFRPVLYIRSKALFARATSTARRKQLLESIAPIDKNPFQVICKYKTVASFDDCDWNGHLSNSSYAKCLDFGRMKTGVGMWTAFYQDGGWMALAGSHFSFIKEIPLGTKYEIHLAIGGWEEKWLYLVAYYVSFPPPSSQKKSSSQKQSTILSRANAISPIISQLPEGAVVHCVAMSQYCFKHGRITVPAALAVGVSGFGIGGGTTTTGGDGNTNGIANGNGAVEHGKTRTARNNSGRMRWEKAKALRLQKKMAPFLRGGWKDVPEEERWWVLEDELEQRRKQNMESLGKLKQAMEAWFA